jgi:hypothetical protein
MDARRSRIVDAALCRVPRIPCAELRPERRKQRERAGAAGDLAEEPARVEGDRALPHAS